MNIKRIEFVRQHGDQQAHSLLRSDESYPFYISLFLFSLGLLALLPSEVRFLDNDGWYLQPGLGPVLGLGTMLVFSFAHICRPLVKILLVPPAVWLEYIVESVSLSRVPILTSGLFYVYIHLVSIIGFFLSTFIFIATLAFLTRLLSRFWLAMSFLVSVLIILVFRVGIGLWMDDVWLYDQLPQALSEFCNMYL